MSNPWETLATPAEAPQAEQPATANPWASIAPTTAAPAEGGVWDEFKSEIERIPADAWAAISQTGPSVVNEWKAFADITKKAGFNVAAKSFEKNLRQHIGIPMDPAEEESLINSISIAMPELGGDRKKIEDYLYRGFHGGKAKEEWEPMARGIVDIGTLALPGGAIGRKVGTKVTHELIKRIAEVEAHNIASFVTWNSLQAAVKEENIPKAAVEGAAMGAVVPPVFYGAGKAAGQAIKLGAKGTKGVVGPAAKLVDRALIRSEAYKEVKKSIGMWYDFSGRAGDAIMEKSGATKTAATFRVGRTVSTLKAAQWISDSWMAMRGLDKGQRKIVSDILHMSKQEADDFVASNPEVHAPLLARATKIAGILEEVGALAEAWGVPMIDQTTKKLRRFKPLSDFGMPHVIVDTEQYITEGKVRDKAIDVLMNRHGKSREAAEKILESIHAHDTLEKEYGFRGYNQLRGRRWGLPGYIEDPSAVLPSYFWNMAKRIEMKQRFGEFDPVTGLPIDKWIGKERTNLREIFPNAFKEVDNIVDPARKAKVEHIVEDQLGKWDTGGAEGKSIAKLLQYQAIMKLGLAQITQATQFVAATIPSGMRDSFKDLLKTMARDPEMQYMAMRTGAFQANLIRQTQAEIVGHQVGRASKSLKGTGFTGMDTAARKYGALRGFTMANYAGEEYARLANRLPKAGKLEAHYINKKMEKIGAKLSDLFSLKDKAIVSGDPRLEQKFFDSLTRNNGAIPDNLLYEAGLKLSTDVNFWSDSLSMPAFFRHPWGRVFLQFKSFGYQQTKFVDKYIVKPALNGDIGPLTRALILNGVTGEAIADLKYALRGKSRKDEGMDRYIKNLSQAAMFGIVGDAIQSTDYGASGVLGFMAGPTITDIATIGEGIFANRKQLGRYATMAGISNIPTPGPFKPGPIIAPAVTNALFPPNNQ